MLNLNRDSIWWLVSILGSIAVGLSTSFNLFPWIDPTAQHVISLVAFIWGIVSGKMATSPLPGGTK